MPGKATVSDFSAAILDRLRSAGGKGAKKTADAMAQHLRDEMQAQKSGTLYTGDVAFTTAAGKAVSFQASDKPYPHQASAPGEAPADWQHALLETIASEQTGPTSAEYSAGSEAAPYLTEFLEHGSPGGKIAPRPLIAPSVDIAGPLLAENVAEAVREALA